VGWYALVFVCLYAVLFVFGWLRSEGRKADPFRPDLHSDSPLEIGILSGLAAAFGVFMLYRKKD
jgi:hypothetical protein